MAERELNFYRVQTRDQALAHLDRFPRLKAERVGLAQALGRVLAEEAISPEDLPPFTRSTVDGYAVRARETFGASESTPGLFELVGEVAMGQPAEAKVRPGKTVKVATGGMLPEGAEAMVMLEYARELDRTTVELTKAVAPGQHLISVGEDVAQGAEVIPAGRVLRPQEIGLLAALGMVRVEVVRRPKVGIISTGNELVPAEETPGPGRIRDVNTHTLAAQARKDGAEPVFLGRVPDDPDRLKELVAGGITETDAVLVSGGSSVGAADWTLRTFMSFPGAELLIHGVSISPGKPLILVRVETESGPKSLWGLPGHVASAMVTNHIFIRPLIRKRLLGAGDEPLRVPAVLSRNLASIQGREDWVRVSLREEEGRVMADPVLGPSGLISTLVRAQGLIRIELGQEGLEAGTRVMVELI